MFNQKLQRILILSALLIALQGSLFASLAIADKTPVAQNVVIDRTEFQGFLARHQFLKEERDSLVAIVDAQKAQVEAVRAESASKSQLIEQLQSQLADSQAQLAIVEEDRRKLESELKDRGFWDTFKNYLIAVLSGIALVGGLALAF